MGDNVTATADAEVVYQDEMREFMVALRRALLMLAGWIEKRYNLD